MKRGILLVAVIMILVNYSAKSLNNDKRSIEITKVSEAPKIDGDLSDNAWVNAANAKDFIQFEPFNGKAPSMPTEVKMVYDDKAIYFGALMYDNSPDSIIKDLGERDDLRRINSDVFSVILSTFNDGVNAVEFAVSASGIQSDMKHNGGRHTDSNWDAVWESEVKITDQGWIVEMKIPYSALRFSQEDVQSWGIHFFRKIRRLRETSTWNFVDVNIKGIINQMGEVNGLKSIEPPLRLSVTPYVSAYIQNDADGNTWGNDFNAGMDLKWGISQSFTLDMILIPDFGQVQSDDEVLNLSPFEVRYDEKRQFFTEGTELFNKGGIFYSRRIGSKPMNSGEAYDQLNIDEIVEENPSETKLINATKISGRTSSGLGIGFLNAMSGAANATILDTIPVLVDGEEKYNKRNFLTQGFTNYNMIVLDQSLKNNSFVSLANTNVYYDGMDYIANVTAGELKLMNKENSYQIFGRGAVSQIYNDSTDLGHKYFFMFSKTKGNFLFDASHNVISDTFDPNDFGFLRRNNESEWRATLSYNFNEPFWKVLNWRNRLSFEHQSLYNPREYTNFRIQYFASTTLAKSYLHSRLSINYNPVEGYDFFEPRQSGWEWKYKTPKSIYANWMFSTDYRKVLAFDFNIGGKQAFENKEYGYWFGVGPRIRFSDKWILQYKLDVRKNFNSYGYVNSYDSTLLNNSVERIIDFGQRDQSTIENTLNTNYIFTNKMSLSLRVRHYWSKVKYSDFFTLQENGDLGPSLGYDIYKTDEDYNYNAFTIDMKYLWRFAPGSELAVVWKNSIYANQTDIIDNFMENFNSTILESTSVNSFSLKILFYLDYRYLVRN